MNNKKSSFRKYSSRESLLAFQYTANDQKEVIEAIGLGFAELVECKIGEDETKEVLFVKVKEATKKRKSRWQNVSENEAVAIEYFSIKDEIFVKKCKITTIKSIEQKFLEDEDEYPLLEEMNKSEARVEKVEIIIPKKVKRKQC